MTSAGRKITQYCRFCQIKHLPVTLEYNTVFAIRDTSPVSPGHMLIIPRRHCIDYFEMTRQERCDTHETIKILKNEILETDATVTGFNLGINCGESSGQTIFHAHVHLIPRRKNDTPSPRGGVRGVIPSRMSY